MQLTPCACTRWCMSEDRSRYEWTRHEDRSRYEWTRHDLARGRQNPFCKVAKPLICHPLLAHFWNCCHCTYELESCMASLLPVSALGVSLSYSSTPLISYTWKFSLGENFANACRWRKIFPWIFLHSENFDTFTWSWAHTHNCVHIIVSTRELHPQLPGR